MAYPAAYQGLPEYEGEDERLCPIHTPAYFAKFAASANTVQRANPTIFVRLGFQIFDKWKQVAGIEEWNVVLALDLHYVLDKFRTDTCVDLWNRIKTIHNLKLIVITFIREEKNVSRRVLEQKAEWTWPMEKADGIVVTTEEESEAEVDEKGVTVTDPLGIAKVILMKGGKGDLLALLGLPGLLVDDRMRNLKHWVKRGPEPSTGILVHGRDWGWYANCAYSYHFEQSILCVSDPLGWVVVWRAFADQCSRMGWRERDRLLQLREEQERRRKEQEDIEHVRAQIQSGWTRWTCKKTGKTYLHNTFTQESKWAPELDVHRSPELDVNTSLKPMSSTDRPGPSSTDRPGTAGIACGSDGWVIGVQRWKDDGKLWPAYKNLSTGQITWARPEDVSLSNASAGFDRAVKEWFESKRKTDPAEAQRQEKAGIKRNFTWQPTGGNA